MLNIGQSAAKPLNYNSMGKVQRLDGGRSIMGLRYSLLSCESMSNIILINKHKGNLPHAKV